MSDPNQLAVFVVDDSPIVRDRLVTILSALPNVAVVGQAETAFEAIESIRNLRPAIVVLDLSMPGGGGMHVLETIKKARPAPLVVVLTNFAYEPYRQKCLQLGADYFFDKSTEVGRLTELLRQLCATETTRPQPTPPADSERHQTN